VQCKEIVDLLGDYLEGELDPETAKALETHLSDCRPCVSFVNTYRGTISASRKLLEEEIPPELMERLRQFLNQRRPA
jgi:anti-sigma factor RsiW